MPTTPPSLAPEIVYIEPKGYEGDDWGKLYHDKDCQNRYTDKTTYPLGNITEGELLVNFTLWTSSKGKNGTIEVFHGTKSIIQLYANATMITHRFEGKIVKEFPQPVNMLEKGVTLFASFRLTKYYVWSGFSSNLWGTEFVVTKYWPETKWWDGQLFKGKGSNTLQIFGDFVTVTPVFIRTLNYDDIKNLSKDYEHVVDGGRTFDIQTIYNENVTFRFRCKYRGFTIELRLISKRKPILSWHTLTDAIETEDYNTKEKRQTNTKLFQFGKPKVFELNIIANKTGNMTKYVFEINGKIYPHNTLILPVPTWKIDQIMVNSDLELFDYKITEEELEMPNKKFKKYLPDLKEFGNIVCLEGRVPEAENMAGEKSFQVYLLNDENDFSEIYGNTALMLDFVFDPEEYSELGENITYTQGMNSALYINSYHRRKGGWGKNKTHKNPIGQTDVPVTIQIIADTHYFKISINGATDFIYHKHRIPAWTINYAMVTGYIQDIDFLESTSEKCLLVEEYKLPSTIIRTEKLEKGDQIIIKGQVPNPFSGSIFVTLMHRTLAMNLEC
ncbi:unnamed protein product [Meloidogyne enterolobii]|uniref:Uncharacterized protein n=1 Tax=Meloidogyne enterolobii TaxID=390850 RepID=A0ACB0ZG01_MELEN